MPDSIAELEARIALLTRELNEARAEQTATSEILGVISSSPTDLQPVFDSIAESAARLCAAQFSFVHRFDGTLLHFMAHHGLSPEALETVRRAFPMAPGRGSAGARAVLSGAVEQIPDVFADADYLGELAEVVNSRSVVAVPMMREGVPIGAIAVDREQPGYFPDRQVELLKTFADQAVIAIGNAQLFEEVQARSREVTESLEQQTATSEILRVIAASPTDIQPVLDAVAKSAAQLCDAYDAIIFLRQGELLVRGAHYGPIPVDFTAFPIGRDWVTGRAVVDRAPVHVHDLSIAADEFPAGQSMAQRLGHRTIMATPLLRNDEAIGGLVIRRTEVRPFTDKQIRLLKTFADQAAIAIENVRLFDEVQARTRDLGEALEQQTATSDALKAISRSAFDLQPVLQTLVDSAKRLGGADMGAITLREGDTLRFMAGTGQAAELHAYERTHPHPLGRGTFQGRAALEGSTIHVPDVLEDTEYERPEAAIMGNFRAVLSVPLKRGQETIGVFGMARRAAGPFAQRQIELVETLADQAVIAIENARLFEEAQARNRELTQSLEQQTATNDILSVISSSPTDLQPVFEMIAERSARLCDAEFSAVLRFDGELVHFVAHHGLNAAALEAMNRKYPMTPGSGGAAARAVLSGAVEQIPDVYEDPDYVLGDVARAGAGRSIVAVPMLKNNRALGAITVAASRPGLFPARQIALLQSFADQAVIAIENVRLFDEVQARNRDVTEALEQQTATGAILRVIAASPTDIQPVLQVVAESAARFCDTHDAVIMLRQDGMLAIKAHYGPIPLEMAPLPINRDWVTGRAFIDHQTLHIHDLLAAGAEFPLGQSLARLAGHRTIVATPLMRDDEPIGAIVIRRTEVRPFSDKQLALVQTFADQAVIAIENVRLFDEVQARNRDVTEALEQQTATSEILRVISSSPTNLQPVFDSIAENAARLCDARFCFLDLFIGGRLHFVAHYGLTPQAIEIVNRTFSVVPGRGSVAGRSMLDGTLVQIPDVETDPEYEMGELSQALGVRSGVAVPMLREGVPIGVITVERVEVGYFPDRQIELLKTFADQAVIAIHNVRLFTELEASNRDVTEALEQQTATAEVLKTISSSAFDLDAVLHTLVKSASDLCHAAMGCIYLRDGDVFHPAMQVGWTQEFYEYMSQHPMRPGRGSVTSRAALTASIVHIPDALDDPEYTFTGGPQIGGFRTLLGVPLIRDGGVMGVFVLARPTVKPFSQREIDLVQTFSDQALIALENVRLFDEVQARNEALTESLEQQTATNDILSVISSSPTNLQPVFDMIAERSARLCEAEFCAVFRSDGDLIHFVADYGLSTAGREAMLLTYPMPPGRSSTASRAIQSAKIEQIPDVLEDPDYAIGDVAKAVNARSVTAVPMLKNNRAIGAINVAASRPGLFAARQIELLKTFADQAVIAIENVRLFDEVQARTAELSESLLQQTATADVLKAISRSTFDLRSVLQALIESAAALCNAQTSGIYVLDGDVYRLGAGHGQSPEFRAFEEAHPDVVGRGSWVGRAALEKSVVHIPDGSQDTEHQFLEIMKLGGFASILCVPLLRQGQPIGIFALTRPEVGPFTERQIELVKTFADQAVIAIENVRLFDEVQARTAELGEALQQQTATADVLKVISRSTFDLQGVLDTLAESVASLCEADRTSILRQVGSQFFEVANYGYSQEFDEYIRSYPHEPGRGTVGGRTLLEGKTVQIPDVLADPEYTLLEGQRLGGFRTALGVPLLRENRPVGVFVLTRSEMKPFTEKQIELVESFADQAVIAIENVRLFDEVQARNGELAESLEQQTATSEILRVISKSPTDIQPVLNAVAESAAQLCDAYDALIFLKHGELLSLAAHHGPIPIDIAAFPATRDWVTGQAVTDRVPVHVHDLQAAGDEFPEGQSMALRLGHRTTLATPLLRDDEAIGGLVIRRTEVRPFTDKQIDLLKTFADQAVIAIENVRLFDEVQARTTELGEALQQQTATADVLKVISASAFDLQAVLDTLAESVARLCEAESAAITRQTGAKFYEVASFGYAPEFSAYIKNFAHEPGRGTVVGRTLLEGKTVQIVDVLADPEYTLLEGQRLGGFRTVLGVPLLRQGSPIGVIVLTRSIVRPFARKQIELVQTFADQAVIAIENVRLFDEVQARTAELGEALQQQTATADVLKVISRSAFDLQTVLDTLTESAVRLCRADKGALERLIDGGFRYVAMSGFPASFRAYGDANPTQIGRGSAVGRAVEERRIIHIEDILKDPEYTHGAVAEAGGIRTVLAVPLLRQDELIGVFAMIRAEPSPFTAREIELVKTFADQAVIAIENVRLFDEVQARTAELSVSLQQQTATADVLKAISRSTFDLQPVLDTLAESAAKLCDADTSVIFKRDGDLYRWSANYGNPPEVEAFAKANPFVAGRDSVTGRVALEARAVHVSDVLADAEYGATQLQKLGGYRTILCVPILREGAPVGVFALTRAEVRDFTPRQIELVETFADQSGIAIENVRLFDEVQARTRELSRSLEDLQTAQNRLVQTEKLASLGQLTAGIAHEIKNPLNFVNNFSALSGELVDDLQGVLADAPLDAAIREEVTELTGMLKGNLEKVVQHGKRADSIVRNMLLHSRAGSGEHRLIDINAVVEESLNLAYHGARAERQGFNVTLVRDFDPQAGEVDLYPQEITRVFLNLISNGFYATVKRNALWNGGPYEPTVTASTKSLGDHVEIRIRDNGTGIPPEVKEQMFNPFFTTKPAGEGTGLGLSLSHDIIVKQHAGTIDVDTRPGEFTEFRIVLPRTAAMSGKSGGEV